MTSPSPDPCTVRPPAPPGVPDTVATGELVPLAIRLALRAGELITAERPDRPEVLSTKSSPTDVVTAMDDAVERLLRAELAAVRPQDGVLGEESGLEPGESGLTWVVDPIDGTVNYLYGLPGFAVSVAVVTGDPRVPGRWQPVAGCVHTPGTGETWSAGLGEGAVLDGRPLRVRTPPDLAGALVATGFGYRPERRRAQARVLQDLLPDIRDIRRFGCASVDLCMVATGRVDAYFERGLKPWDIAAGMLIAAEAGAVVRGVAGLPPGPDLLVAAAPPLVDHLADRLGNLGAHREDSGTP
jgi:myo-inositol-1(or 4)-monophosphatase